MKTWIEHALHCITEYEVCLNEGDDGEAEVWEQAAEESLTRAKEWEGLDFYCGDVKELVDYQFGNNYPLSPLIQ